MDVIIQCDHFSKADVPIKAPSMQLIEKEFFIIAYWLGKCHQEIGAPDNACQWKVRISRSLIADIHQ